MLWGTRRDGFLALYRRNTGRGDPICRLYLKKDTEEAAQDVFPHYRRAAPAKKSRNF